MWTMIPSLQPCVEVLLPAFTQPTFLVNAEFLLAWIMTLGSHSLLRVGRSSHPERLPDNSQRHGLDRSYNFFERSAWTPSGLAQRLAVLILTKLNLGNTITLLIDDTLTHKRGTAVWGLGWFRDAVASTKKRVATASGHNWVLLCVAVCVPGTTCPILALPLLARLHLPGKGQRSCPELARQMLTEVLGWYPDRRFVLVGDGGYAARALLADLDERVECVGRLRGDAAVFDPRLPAPAQGKRGPKPKKGSRLDTPKEAAARADGHRPEDWAWWWQWVEVMVYGSHRWLQATAYEVVWPRVLGYRRIRIVVVRDPTGKMSDTYLFSTDLNASLAWIITQFAWRWSIEVTFRASKQVLDIEAPQHWCQASVEKVAPWVWSMQSVIMVWYLTEGRELPEAQELGERMGAWDSEWSLRHMVQVLQRSIAQASINPNSAEVAELRTMVETLKNWAFLAA